MGYFKAVLRQRRVFRAFLVVPPAMPREFVPRGYFVVHGLTPSGY